mgnify:CR=1 FL=1
MTTRTGGCLCGAVRYEVTGDPMMQVACHCTDCQKASGGSPTLALVVAPGAVKVTKGTPKRFVSKGDSGAEVVRVFCDNCGSPLFSEPASSGGAIMVVKIGSLDDPSDFKPQIDMYMSSARPWHAPHEGAMQFPKGPPVG